MSEWAVEVREIENVRNFTCSDAVEDVITIVANDPAYDCDQLLAQRWLRIKIEGFLHVQTHESSIM